MRSFVNKPGSAITESLRGMALCHPEMLEIHYEPDFVRRTRPTPRGKVAVISGSGSGHEPLPTGYVGTGMLDAACPGPIFTSPSPTQMVAATQAVEAGGGVVYIVKNYTGGVLNSELTVEMMESEGITARTVLVNDDVAIAEAGNRRGLGAAPLVMKIAGAAAEAGYGLEDVVKLARRAASNARSMGVGTNTNTLPRAIHPRALTEDSVELGIGIHGEPGRRFVVEGGIDEIADELIGPILADLPASSGDDVLLLVSGLGGTPSLELYLFFQAIHERLGRVGLHVKRQLVGNYLTSLGRGGYLVTVLKLDDDLLHLWDAPVCTPAMRW
ncbi:dihydroxyacetone kinase subunit DhaK [bacterium]|nr:dihydroxyacetone kinase subunit DhaK [bacterium]